MARPSPVQRSSKGAARRAPAAARQPAASGARIVAGLVLVALGAVSFAIVPALFLVLLTGLAPTILSLFFRSPKSGNFLPTMVALNIAGVIPVVARLWSLGMTQDAAELLLRDPMMWLLMFGSALLAVALQWAMPGMIRVLLDIAARSQAERLRKAQAALIEEWGPEVSGEKPKAAPTQPANAAAPIAAPAKAKVKDAAAAP